jgi:hypothetical protein
MSPSNDYYNPWASKAGVPQLGVPSISPMSSSGSLLSQHHNQGLIMSTWINPQQTRHQHVFMYFSFDASFLTLSPPSVPPIYHSKYAEPKTHTLSAPHRRSTKFTHFMDWYCWTSISPSLKEIMTRLWLHTWRTISHKVGWHWGVAPALAKVAKEKEVSSITQRLIR